MNNWKRGMSIMLAGTMLAACPAAAFGASPEFARTAEEWERLRDNVLEYEELEDLIAEYNTTVQTNQLELNEFKRDYGTTKDDVADKYRDMADEDLREPQLSGQRRSHVWLCGGFRAVGGDPGG